MTSHTFVATRRTFLHGFFCLVSGSVRFLNRVCLCHNTFLLFLPFPLPLFSSLSPSAPQRTLFPNVSSRLLRLSRRTVLICCTRKPTYTPQKKKGEENIVREDEGWWYKGGKGGGSYGKYRTESDKNSAEESSSFCFFSFSLFLFFLAFFLCVRRVEKSLKESIYIQLGIWERKGREEEGKIRQKFWNGLQRNIKKGWGKRGKAFFGIFFLDPPFHPVVFLLKQHGFWIQKKKAKACNWMLREKTKIIVLEVVNSKGFFFVRDSSNSRWRRANRTSFYPPLCRKVKNRVFATIPFPPPFWKLIASFFCAKAPSSSPQLLI